MNRLRAAVAALALAGMAVPALAAEQPVAPYVQSDANAGATPFHGDGLYKALHGQAGIGRIVDAMMDENIHDPRTADIFKAIDAERLRRTLIEQVCYIAGGPCHYTGMDMKTAHKNMGLQEADFNALVEHLQDAMDKERVPFYQQNRLLAKLAPMKRTTVER